MLVDSHCHLNFPEFTNDIAAVMTRARQSDIGVMQTICTKLSEFPEILDLTVSQKNLYCSIGVHPHNVAEEIEFNPEKIMGLLEGQRKVIGIGETGLDYYYQNSPREVQRESFIKHIAVARETRLPVIIHSRDADEDTIQILKEENKRGCFPGLIHCFTAGPELAEVALECGLSISLSGIITFKNASELRALAGDIPMDRLLLETDAPFLAPVPCRGMRNEPSFLRHTADFVAQMLEVAPDLLEERTTQNFHALFRRADSYNE